MVKLSEMERFLRKVNVNGPDGCWEWTGRIDGSDYGKLNVSGRSKSAHRHSWNLHFGPIPSGLCICHHCDNKICVNPSHLFLGTHRDNAIDMIEKGRYSNAKLTREKVVALRAEYAAGGVTYRELAEKYGVGISGIKLAATGVTWSHVD